jgi:hypothetical protein
MILKRLRSRSRVMRRVSAVLLAAGMCGGALVAAPIAASADGGPWSYQAFQDSNGSWEEFWVASNCQVYHAWGSDSPYGPFPYSASLGGCALANYGLDAGRNADGRLELFVVGTNEEIFHNWQEAPSSGPWSGWYQLGNFQVVSGPRIVSSLSGQSDMTVFAEGTSGFTYYNRQDSPGCCWSGWIFDS